MALLVDILAVGAIDDTGEALDSGVVYLYKTGTNTIANAYYDVDGLNPAPNPITLDAAGRAEIYIDEAVRITIEDSQGNTIDEIDNFGGEQAFNTVTSASGTSGNNAIAVFSGTTGGIIKPSGVFIDAGNSVTGVDDLSVNGDLDVTGDSSFTGDVQVTGDLSGTPTLTGDLDLNGGTIDSTFANESWESYTRTSGADVDTRGVAISSSCGNFSTGSTSFTSVTNLDVDIDTVGRPVMVQVQPDGSTDYFRIAVRHSTPTSDTSVNVDIEYRIRRNSTEIARGRYGIFLSLLGGATQATTDVTSGATINFVDTGVTAGTHTYDIQIRAQQSDTETVYMRYAKLVAYEL